MRQWTNQHNVATRWHKVVMPSLFMLSEGRKSNLGELFLCEGRKSNPGDPLLCEGSKSNPGNLLLCEGNKSNPGHTLLTCPPATTFYPFSTNNRSIPYPICTAFSLYFPFQPRDRHIQSLLLSPCYFLFESSPRFMLQLSPFLRSLNKTLDSNA